MSVVGLSDEEVSAIQQEFGLSEAEIQKEVDAIQKGETGQSSHYPAPPKKDDLLKFMRDIRSEEQKNYDRISRTGNLQDGEIGKLTLTQRTYLNIGNYNESEGYEDVAFYLRKKANIWADTSLSRKALFVKLPFSNTNIMKSLSAPKTTTKKSLFGGEQVIQEGGEE